MTRHAGVSMRGRAMPSEVRTKLRRAAKPAAHARERAATPDTAVAVESVEEGPSGAGSASEGQVWLGRREDMGTTVE